MARRMKLKRFYHYRSARVLYNGPKCADNYFDMPGKIVCQDHAMTYFWSDWLREQGQMPDNHTVFVIEGCGGESGDILIVGMSDWRITLYDPRNWEVIEESW